MSKSNTEYKSNSAMRRRYEQLVAGTCIFGIIICLYTIKVEVFKSYDSSYKALCDFNEWISCSKVFTSKYVCFNLVLRLVFYVKYSFNRYGKGFGLMPEDSILNQPNGIFGLTFFTTQLVLGKN
jgi:vitamin-K-epoxide reductase (warfarin-sensitive)